MTYIQQVVVNGTIGLIEVNITEYKDSAMTIPFNFNKDTTGLTYKFVVADANGTEIYEKELDVLNLILGEWQLTVTKNLSTDDWQTLDVGEYKYVIKECVTATGGDSTVLMAGRFCVLDPFGDC